MSAPSIGHSSEPVRFEPPKLAVSTGIGRIGRATVGIGALNEAREAGRQEALAEVEQLIEQHRRGRLDAEHAGRSMHLAAQQLRALDAETLADVQHQVIALAVALAETIIGREVRAFDDVANEAAERALALVPDRGPVVLRVNPADRASIAEHVQAVQRPDEVTVVADPSIGRGGCTAQVGALLVDATVEAAIERLRGSFGI